MKTISLAESGAQFRLVKGSSSKTRTELAQEFAAAPLDALLAQPPVAAWLDVSEALLERHRWAGTGIPYLKLGRAVRYRKSDVLAWLTDKSRTSTTTAA